MVVAQGNRESTGWQPPRPGAGEAPEGQGLPEVHESWLPREHSLYRPRHGGRQVVALVSAAIFFGAPLAAYALGARAGEIENRPLVEFPSPTEGWGFFTGLSQWATDNLVFREAAVHAADGISRGVFDDGSPFGGQRGGSPVDQGPIAPPAPQEDTPPAEDGPLILAESSEVIEGKEGWLYYGYDIEGKCSQNRPIDDTIAGMRELRRVVEESGRRLVVLVVPDKSTVVPEYMPDQYPGMDCAEEVRDELWQRLPEETGAIDPRVNLMQGGTAASTYHRLDTHWNDEGAIIGLRRIAEAVQPGITRSWRTVPDGRWEHSPDLPPLLGRAETEETTRFQLRPDGRTDRTRARTTRITEPVRFESEPVEGTVPEKVAMLGDSFMISTSRYVPAAFNDLTLISYTVAHTDRQLMLDVLADSEVIVVQVVERVLANGVAPFADPEVVADIERTLAAHPR